MILGIKTSLSSEPEASDPLDGISSSDCPYECTAENCSIVNAPICSHPHKGGLQAKFMSDPEILRRFNDARQRLAHERTANHEAAVRRSSEGTTDVF